MARPNRFIILDARMIRHSGIGTHVRGLLDGWREVAPDFRPALLGDPTELSQCVADLESYTVIPFQAPIYGLREQFAFPAGQTRGALLHCPHYNIALRHRGPLVVTIHDLIHIHPLWGLRPGPGRLYANRMLRRVALRANHIFAVSKATADDVVSRLEAYGRRITVTYNAPSRLFLESNPSVETIKECRSRRKLPADYLLTVGLYKPHKNLDMLLDSLKPLWDSGRVGIPLLVAGIQEKDRRRLENRLRDMEIAEWVRILEHLPGQELPLLYAGARAMVHPSLIEGFGLPIVESQAMGCPVLASRAPAVPEVAGDGAVYFDPQDPDDLALRIVEIVNDDALRRRLATAGRENVKRFSWSETAKKVLSVYERIE